MPGKHRCHIVGVVLWIAMLSLGQTAAADESTGDDRWYVLMLGDQRAGHMHASTTTDGDQIISHTTISLSIQRGTLTIKTNVQSRFVETTDGKPVQASSTLSLAMMKVTQTMQFTDQGIVLISEQAGQKQRQQLPNPTEPWLPPAALQRYIQSQLDAGAKRIETYSLDPLSGPQPVHTTMVLVGHENVEVFGKVVPATVWDVTMTGAPFPLRDYTDQHGNTIKSTMPILPGMDLTILAADEALAKSRIDPPELLAATLIHVDRAIARPRELQSARYELKITGDDPPNSAKIDLPQGGFQQVRWIDDRTAEITVDLTKPVSTDAADQPGPEHLAPSVALNSDDPKIKQLLADALGAQASKLDAHAKARRLQKFVRQHIKAKDLSVGFATASEVARTATGDCTEHAVLLAALFRAANIPSRTVTGVVYVDQFLGRRGVFGYHMWAQAWIEDAPGTPGTGHWLDLDAALSSTTGFDATHIALSNSAMADQAMVNDMVSTAAVIGRLSIRVDEAR